MAIFLMDNNHLKKNYSLTNSLGKNDIAAGFQEVYADPGSRYQEVEPFLLQMEPGDQLRLSFTSLLSVL